MTDSPKAKNKSQSQVFPTVSEAIGSINSEDRIKTLIYAFKKALEAGNAKDGKDFDSEAAIAALENGRLQLRGTQEQIAGQLVLIRGATSVLRRALDYDAFDEAKPLALDNKAEEKPHPQPLKNSHAPKMV